MLNSIRKMLAGASDAPPSASTIAAAIDVLDVKAAEARATLAAADDRRADAILQDDAAAAAVRKTITSLAEDLADMSAARGRLVDRLAAARAAEAEADRKARYDAAQAAADAAAKALRKTYGPAVASLRGLLRQIETAAALVEAANADLPSGSVPIADPEMSVRGTPWQPAEVVSETVVQRWVPAGGDHRFPLPVDREHELKMTGPDRAEIITSRPIGNGSVERGSIPYRRVSLIETVKRPGIAGETGPMLRGMLLPGLRSTDGRFDPPGFNASHDAIIALLDAAEETVPAVAIIEPKLVTEYRAVPTTTATDARAA